MNIILYKGTIYVLHFKKSIRKWYIAIIYLHENYIDALLYVSTYNVKTFFLRSIQFFKLLKQPLQVYGKFFIITRLCHSLSEFSYNPRRLYKP